uniref:BPTI/Kunitz inhibitor domain-containing protein n=1 Tax=Panagrolaimus sp. ES5 TaxID=591445 RepID=A0AC34FL00_9BILA
MKLLIILCLAICFQLSFEIVLNVENLPKVPQKDEKILDFIEKRKIEAVKNKDEQLLKKKVYTHEKNPICFLDAEIGPCFALYRPYFFNKKTGKCEEFVYGGCKGNSNRFETIEECEKQCL